MKYLKKLESEINVKAIFRFSIEDPLSREKKDKPKSEKNKPSLLDQAGDAKKEAGKKGPDLDAAKKRADGIKNKNPHGSPKNNKMNFKNNGTNVELNGGANLKHEGSYKGGKNFHNEGGFQIATEGKSKEIDATRQAKKTERKAEERATERLNRELNTPAEVSTPTPKKEKSKNIEPQPEKKKKPEGEGNKEGGKEESKADKLIKVEEEKAAEREKEVTAKRDKEREPVAAGLNNLCEKYGCSA